MYVWSKRIVGTLVAMFFTLEVVFWVTGSGEATSALLTRTTQWITLNYILLLVWVFVWMYDQARVRGKNVWLWLAPFAIAPLLTLMLYVMYLQRRVS